MSLRRVQVTDFRCLQSAALDLDSRFTLISGPNASGKTSLLESMYVLGRGRSFRTRRLEHLIRHGTSQFVVFGEVETAERTVPLGVEGTTAGVRARIAGAKAASLAELALMLPVQIIDPEVHRLIEEGPSRRRRFLDWGRSAGNGRARSSSQGRRNGTRGNRRSHGFLPLRNRL